MLGAWLWRTKEHSFGTDVMLKSKLRFVLTLLTLAGVLAWFVSPVSSSSREAAPTFDKDFLILGSSFEAGKSLSETAPVVENTVLVDWEYTTLRTRPPKCRFN